MAHPRDDLTAQIAPGNFSPDYQAERINRGAADVLARQNSRAMVPPPRVRVKSQAADANYVSPGPAPFQCGNCRYIVWGTSRPEQDPNAPDADTPLDLCQVVHGPHEDGGVLPEDSCRLWLPKPVYPLRYPKEAHANGDSTT